MRSARCAPRQKKSGPVRTGPPFVGLRYWARWKACSPGCREATALVLVHSAHTAGATWAAACGCCLLFVFLEFSHERFGGEHQAGDRGGVLQSEAGDLGWVNNASLHHI